MDVAERLDDAAYLKDYDERVAARWPAGTPREPTYPFGEIPLEAYLKRWAEDAPDRPAIDFYGRALSYAELDRMVDRCTAMLQGAGVVPGSRVALYLGNCPQFVVAMLAVLRAGAVHVPVNPMFKEHELAYELSDSGATFAIVQDTLAPLLAKVRADHPLQAVWSTGLADLAPAEPAWHMPPSVASNRAAADGTPDLLDAIAAAPERPRAVERELDAVCKLNYTGGTTAMPKGCAHTERDMLYTAATATVCCLKIGPGDAFLNFYPLFWIAGEDAGIVFPIFRGATSVLLGRWDPLSFMQAVEARGVRQVGMLVDNAVEVLEHPRAGEHDLTSLEATHVSSFVKKLNKDFRDRWRALTGSTMAELAWGMTETQTCDTFTVGLQDDDYDLTLQPILVGLPMPGTRFRIADFDTGETLGFDVEGEICVASPSIMKAYWNKPEASAAALRGGWFHTGDIGLVDGEGLLHFLGRRKEMLKVRGMSVFPAEIEAMLGRHPAVLGAGVIGRPDEARGEVPVAFVRLDPERGAGLDAAALEAWCGEAMATYKRPEVRLVDELPMTATGKVKKEELAKLL